MIKKIKNQGTFVVLKSAGMGNRLKSYVSHLARWDQILIEHPADALLFDNLKLATSDDIKKYPNTGAVWQLLADPEEEEYIEKYRTIDFLFNDTPNYFIKKYLPIWDTLKININKKIIEKVDELSKDWDFDNMTCLNIRYRRNDFQQLDFINFQGFEDEIKNTKETFFLASDDLSVKNYYKNKYKNRCLVYERKEIIDSGYTIDYDQNMQALVEMILLSKCKKMVFTLGTTFNECSWWLSGCNKNVVLPVFWDKIPKHWWDAHMVKK